VNPCPCEPRATENKRLLVFASAVVAGKKKVE
jgi:hypothetical protein